MTYMLRSLDEIKEIAGEEVMEKAYDFFDGVDRSELKMVCFFNSPRERYSGRNLYELCEDGESEEVLKFFGRLEHGVFQ